MADLAALEQTLGIVFSDLSLLEQALIHSSYLNENPGLVQSSNERLEFLGDAVLGLVIAGKLYQDYPQFAEGEMTKLRSALVRRETLARMARTIGLGNYLYLGRGEESTSGRNKPANLASALEAVIAAVFIDRGFPVARDVILRLVDEELQKAIRQGTAIDYKSQLQELTQSREQQIPTYHVIETTGPDHGKIFTVEVRLGEVVLGKGSGKNKKLAETQAAKSALEQIPDNFTQ